MASVPISLSDASISFTIAKRCYEAQIAMGATQSRFIDLEDYDKT